MVITLLLLLSSALAAEELAPVGLVRGTLLECDGGGATGQFSIRTEGNRVFRFHFDSRTYFEREKQRVTPGKLQNGELLEIVSDRAARPAVRYARIVHVLQATPDVRPSARLERLRAYRNATEHIVPRGNLTYSGTVSRLDDGSMVLRTRLDGVKVILLRADTRYLHRGSVVDLPTLIPATRVFVRAGKNLDDELEAYQVIWGEILASPASYY